MAKQTTAEALIFLKGRKRYGFSHSFGSAFYGYTRFGDFNEFSGIYQYRNSAKQRYHVKTLMYWPRNPRTEPQQAWRAVFSVGAVNWAGLTSEQKASYNERAKPLHMTGYHLHQREWLASHYL